MITTNLTGNFGDHAIRYALARTVAEKNGYKWGINPVPSHDYYGGKSQLYFFDLDYGLPNNTPYGFLPPGIKHEWEEKVIHYSEFDFYTFQPDIFSIEDNTNLKIFCGRDARYYDRNKLNQWFTFKEEEEEKCKAILEKNEIVLDDNLVVINCRGGEYRGVPDLFLKLDYFMTAAHHMLKINPNLQFIVITDDVEYFKNIFGCPVMHFSIACDYYIVNHAVNLILSNSGFGLFPAWLNDNTKNVIAPMHWARHNIGKWANSDVWTFAEEKGWLFLDRYGELYNYDEVKK